MKRTILITGANGNLGQDVVSLLASEGHTLIAVTGSGEIQEDQRDKVVLAKQANLTKESEANALVQDLIKNYPDIDAAVLLVGGFGTGDIASTDEQSIDKFFALNFKSALFVAKPLMAHFKSKGIGQFILMGARPAIQPVDGKKMVAYALSKSLLFNLAELLNAEGKNEGITASVIVPSTMDTPQNREGMPNADFNLWVKPSDVAKTISFILSVPGSQLRQPVFKMYNRS